MSITKKINILIISVLFVLGIFSILVSSYHMIENSNKELENISSLMNKERRMLLENVTANAFSIVKTANFYTDAIRAIKDMRFGPEGENFFYIIDTDGIMMMNPENPELEEKNALNIEDSSGRKIVKEMLELAQTEKEGFLSYAWPKGNKGTPQPRLCYVKFYKDWNWVLIAGLFLDDIEMILNEKEREVHGLLISRVTWSSGIIIILMNIVIFISNMVTRRLLKPIQASVESLSETFGEVTGCAAQMASVSLTVSNGSAEQAAAVQNSSVSLGKVLSKSKQNADVANHANDLMKNDAASNFKLIENRMDELQVAIENTISSSEKTTKIVKTIDEIAFQTNLLALNAAVEAARAGDVGAGFAVVAKEVRRLALRVADAAKNTTSLIQEARDHNLQAAEFSKQVVDAIDKNKNIVGKVSLAVEDVAEVSNDQVTRLNIINGAMTNIDEITQENSAGSEETAAASEHMKIQAAFMQEIVKKINNIISGKDGNGSAAEKKQHNGNR
ncbi:MAG: cache domain-containing protein [Desulfobacterales bacterium]|nr:cache domain-containing protein [Desulfobacterales bacterium]